MATRSPNMLRLWPHTSAAALRCSSPTTRSIAAKPSAATHSSPTQSSATNQRSKSIGHRIFEKGLGDRFDDVAGPILVWSVTPIRVRIGRPAKSHDDLDVWTAAIHILLPIPSGQAALRRKHAKDLRACHTHLDARNIFQHLVHGAREARIDRRWLRRTLTERYAGRNKCSQQQAHNARAHASTSPPYITDAPASLAPHLEVTQQVRYRVRSDRNPERTSKWPLPALSWGSFQRAPATLHAPSTKRKLGFASSPMTSSPSSFNPAQT